VFVVADQLGDAARVVAGQHRSGRQHRLEGDVAQVLLLGDGDDGRGLAIAPGQLPVVERALDGDAGVPGRQPLQPAPLGTGPHDAQVHVGRRHVGHGRDGQVVPLDRFQPTHRQQADPAAGVRQGARPRIQAGRWVHDADPDAGREVPGPLGHLPRDGEMVPDPSGVQRDPVQEVDDRPGERSGNAERLVVAPEVGDREPELGLELVQVRVERARLS
jgi:hypothetical protein